MASLVVDAVLCAHNEAPRIGPVIRAVLAARCLRRVLVVDDGSTDATGDVARAAGATVLALRPNRGKGAAMRAGVSALRAAGATPPGAVLFVDGDLHGLRPDHVCRLVDAVANRGCGQAAGLRDHGDALSNEMQKGMPILTGERCVRMDLLARVPARYWSGFLIEAAINEVVARSGRSTCLTVFDGVDHAMRYAKRGEGEGIRQLVDMTQQILEAMARMAREQF